MSKPISLRVRERLRANEAARSRFLDRELARSVGMSHRISLCAPRRGQEISGRGMDAGRRPWPHRPASRPVCGADGSARHCRASTRASRERREVMSTKAHRGRLRAAVEQPLSNPAEGAGTAAVLPPARVALLRALRGSRPSDRCPDDGGPCLRRRLRHRAAAVRHRAAGCPVAHPHRPDHHLDRSRSAMHAMIDHLPTPVPCWLLFDAAWPITARSAEHRRDLLEIVAIGRVQWIPGSKTSGTDDYCRFLCQRPRRQHRYNPVQQIVVALPLRS